MQDANVDNVFLSDAEEEPNNNDVEALTRTSAANLRGSIGNNTLLNSY